MYEGIDQYWRWGALGVAACLSCVAFSARSAVAASTASCQFQTHITLSSPLSNKATHGTFSSDDGRSAACTGMLGGALVSPGGSFGIAASYGSGGLDVATGGDTCSLGSA